MDTSRFLGSSVLDDRVALTAGGSPAYAQHAALVELLRSRAPRAAGLFAEPVFDKKGDASPARLSWYAPAGDDPVPLEQLAAGQRAAAENDLREQIAAVLALARERGPGSLAAASLMVPSLSDVVWTGERAVLLNWGIVPAAVGDAPAQRAAHFRTTLGRFAPPGADPWTAAPAAAATASTGAAMAAAAGGAAPPSAPIPSPPGVPPPTPPARGLGALSAASAILLSLLVVLLVASVALAAGYYFGWRYLAAELARTAPKLPPLEVSETAERMQGAINDGLRRRIAALEGALQGDVCVATTLDPRRPVESLPAGPQTPIPGPGGLPSPTSPPGTGTPGQVVGGPGQPQQPQQPLIPPPPETQPVTPPPGPGGTAGPTNLRDLLRESTVLVFTTVRTQRGVGFAHGSGFAIGGGHIVTNRHVVESNPGDMYVINAKLGRAHRAQVVAQTPPGRSPAPDYAVLRLEGADLGALPLAAEIDSLDPVVAAGYPGFVVETDDAMLRLQRGDAGSVPQLVLLGGDVSVVQSYQSARVIVHTAPMGPGNSGGPLVDRCGRAVGVNTFGRGEEGSPHLARFAQSATSLIAFLRQNNIAFRDASDRCVPAPPVAAAAPGEATAPGAGAPPPAPAATPAPAPTPTPTPAPSPPAPPR